MNPPSPTSDSRTTQDTRPQPVSAADPFNTPFDDEHEEQEDEWWNDETTTVKTEEAATGSRLTHWPTLEKSVPDRPANSSATSKSSPKRYSVQKPTRDKSKQRQKKQNALAGIKVVTDFSRHRGPTPVTQQPIRPLQPSHDGPNAGQFVDLAALQALNSDPPNNAGGLWRSIMDILPNKSDVLAQNQQDLYNSDVESAQGLGNRRSQPRLLAPLKVESDLSPNDRPVVIGISVPSANLEQHVMSPQTAMSETSKIIHSYGVRSPNDETPETPAIVITPAHDSLTWTPSERESTAPPPRPRATSSVYSRATNYNSGLGFLALADAPPMPQMPAYATKENQQRKHDKHITTRESVDTLFLDDEEWVSPARSRALSSCTVFEEDESPILVRKGRARSYSVSSKHASKGLNADHRQSKGWWNVISTPFLTRSNTLASLQKTNQVPPVLPNLEIAAMKAHEASTDKVWEKTFSPLSPQTSTTIASDAWWDKQSPSGPVANPFRRTVSEAFAAANGHRSQKSEDESGTLPFMLLTSAHPDNEMQRVSSARTQATRSSALSPSDRDAPFILADSTATQSIEVNQDVNRPQAQPTVASQSVVRDRVPMIDEFPQPPRAVLIRSPSSLPQSPQPPPYSPPRPRFPRYRAILPPGHPGSGTDLQQPPSPGPLSPGLQQAMSTREGIALSDVPLTPRAPRRPIKLNSAYPGLPANPRSRVILASDLGLTSEKARKVEARRRRNEHEDAIVHRAGGLWRGRACFPKRGCYGRQGVEGRRRRRVWFGVVTGFLTLIILVVVLVTTLHHKQSHPLNQSQWLNLTGFPPIFTGISTVAAPDNPVAKTACVFPATAWSCSLPKEQQQIVAPNQPNQPNFRLEIQWDNSTAANSTFANVTGKPNVSIRSLAGSAVSVRQILRRFLLGRQSLNFNPSPSPPALAEQFFLGNTTDGIVSEAKAGEPTPFYITFLSAGSVFSLEKRDLAKRSNSSDPFPDIEDFIPPPDNNPDGTAAPANLLPLPFQQPLRLYDRGLVSEHYGFYTYFNRSIFLKSTSPLNQSNLDGGEVPDDENGGSTEAAAAVRCTWSETRFLVQLWTRRNSTATLLDSPSTTSISTSTTSTSTNGLNSTANDFKGPGSFPYPITITTDRHGGDPAKKLVYCYKLDSREHNVQGSAKVQQEQRFFGGEGINPAPNIFSNSSNTALGGFDGGTGGCSCQWQNWKLIDPF